MARTSAQNEWRARNSRVQVNLELNPSDREDWKAFAESMGQTLPGMVREAVKECMVAHGWVKCEAEKNPTE